MNTATESITRLPIAYTIEEFARDHRISRSQVYVEISSDRLIARKVGARTLITAEDAKAWRDALPKAPAKKSA